MIALKNICKYYYNKYNRTFILKNVDLSVAEGEFISIMAQVAPESPVC